MSREGSVNTPASCLPLCSETDAGTGEPEMGEPETADDALHHSSRHILIVTGIPHRLLISHINIHQTFLLLTAVQ